MRHFKFCKPVDKVSLALGLGLPKYLLFQPGTSQPTLQGLQTQLYYLCFLLHALKCRVGRTDQRCLPQDTAKQVKRISKWRKRAFRKARLTGHPDDIYRYERLKKDSRYECRNSYN